MTEAVKTPKKEQVQRARLIGDSWDELIEKKRGEWDVNHSFEEYAEGSTLEELVISAIQRLDLSLHADLDDLRKTVFDIKKELETLIRNHKHSTDGSACKPI